MNCAVLEGTNVCISNLFPFLANEFVPWYDELSIYKRNSNSAGYLIVLIWEYKFSILEKSETNACNPTDKKY